ncbi:MAG: YkgJ family cysteine cluster protein [Bacteroidota bacterium]
MITPEDLPSLAGNKRKANKKFIQKLKKRPPKDLDQQVHAIHEEVFEEVDCLACANCCKTISPVFTDRDIDRIAHHLRMKPSDFVEQYLHIDEEEDYVLNTAPCPFLGADNYCGIYDVRPKACREYPHTDRRDFAKKLNLTLKNTMVCPAAYEVVERMKESITV